MRYRNVLLGDVVERNGLLYPSCEAVVDENRRLTFAELADRAIRFANVIVDSGLRRGARISVLAPNCHELVEIFGGSEMCGTITVPLNIRMTQHEIAAVVADCTPSMLVFDRSFQPLIDAL